ncbi:hypothetical protein [Pseudoflavitalea rhizosphaerae]|uniref:hypothetical protein n=1 Tax=Pseudoflavitalea rhizosphaerae TaxID=1884793 RepID=UPI000F8E939F|nr:hypothetical protein [Pseudoflavitalea rhizosphaerae]
MKKHFIQLSGVLLLMATPVMLKAQTVEEVGNAAEKIGKLFKKKKKENPEATATSTSSTAGKGNNKITIHSKYDFVAGDSLLFADNFNETENGKFPARWKTNGSGEVVTIDEYDGKWFSLASDAVYIPKIKGGITKDFTIEFDLIIANSSNSHTLYIDFEDALNGNFDLYPKNPYLQLRIYDGGMAYADNKARDLDAHVTSSTYNEGGKKNHIAIRKQGERLQVYINEEKTFDITNAFEGKRTYSTFKLGAEYNNPAAFLISNVKINSL